MGYNTTVFIINDGLGEIESHPEQFVEGINHHLNNGGTVAVGCHANCVEVMPSAHADIFRLYASRGNRMVELSPYNEKTRKQCTTHSDLIRSDIETARSLLDQLEGLLDDQ
jgi:hypothetical protein